MKYKKTSQTLKILLMHDEFINLYGTFIKDFPVVYGGKERVIHVGIPDY